MPAIARLVIIGGVAVMTPPRSRLLCTAEGTEGGSRRSEAYLASSRIVIAFGSAASIRISCCGPMA